MGRREILPALPPDLYDLRNERNCRQHSCNIPHPGRDFHRFSASFFGTRQLCPARRFSPVRFSVRVLRMQNLPFDSKRKRLATWVASRSELEPPGDLLRLPVTTSVAATAVGPTTSMESAAPMNVAVPVESATATLEAVASARHGASVKLVTAVEAGIPVETRVPVITGIGSEVLPSATVVPISRAAVKAAIARTPAAEPRTRSYKHTTDKIVRPVVAIGRAGVGIITIVAVGADRSWSHRPHTHERRPNPGRRSAH